VSDSIIQLSMYIFIAMLGWLKDIPTNSINIRDFLENSGIFLEESMTDIQYIMLSFIENLADENKSYYSIIPDMVLLKEGYINTTLSFGKFCYNDITFWFKFTYKDGLVVDKTEPVWYNRYIQIMNRK